MGTKQSQKSKPLAGTEALLNLLAFYLAGPGLAQFTNRDLKAPVFGGGAGGGMPAGMGGGGMGQSLYPTGSQFQPNPMALMASGGQMGAGNIPGTILPNYPNLLQLSNRSFFGSMNPQMLGTTFGRT